MIGKKKTKSFILKSGGSVSVESLQNYIVEDIMNTVKGQAEVYVKQKLKIDSSIQLFGNIVSIKKE